MFTREEIEEHGSNGVEGTSDHRRHIEYNTKHGNKT